jgi:hypothetical protein
LYCTGTYVGAATLKELSKRTTFVRCTVQLNESLSQHNATIGHGYNRLNNGSTQQAGGAANGAAEGGAPVVGSKRPAPAE